MYFVNMWIRSCAVRTYWLLSSEGYFRATSRLLGKRRVQINAIGPGDILFDDSVWAKKLKEDSAAVAEMLELDEALEKLRSFRDIANFKV